MRKTFVVLGFCACIVSTAYSQTSYPKPTGHVNDFANIIDAVAERDLETKLREYRDQTSIEIAVATVSSLGGVTIEEYALNLFQEWGIGDRTKDNGILVLVAPNERKMKIEVGYGMEPDLTDAQAGRVIENNIIPHFKEERMTQGIVEGVGAVIVQLGNTPFETRLEERRIVAERKLIEDKRRAEEGAAFMKFLGAAIMVFFLIGTPIFIVYRKAKHKQKLQQQYRDNEDLLTKCGNHIGVAEANYSVAKDALEKLKTGNPREVWVTFEEAIAGFSSEVATLRISLDSTRQLHTKGGWEKSEHTANSLLGLTKSVEILVNLESSIKRRTQKVESAKEESPKLLEKTLGEFEAARVILSHKDISDGARKCLGEAKRKCEGAQVLMRGQGLINWLAVYGLISEAGTLITKAKSTADSDKRAAEEARRPKPVYRSSYSSSSSSSSSGGSSRSSFGGFGGGRSGGGGARGKW